MGNLPREPVVEETGVATVTHNMNGTYTSTRWLAPVLQSVERQAELLSAQEELKLQQQLNSDLQTLISEKELQQVMPETVMS